MTSLSGKPETRIITFQNYSDGFNRLYFFNAMKNSIQANKGMTYYLIHITSAILRPC